MSVRSAIDEIMVMEISPDGKSVSGHLKPGAGFPGFQGHFPDNPTLPGVCHVAIAEVFAERATSLRLELAELSKTKFFLPVRPDTSLSVTGRFTRSDDRLSAEVTLMSGENRVSVVKCRFRVTE